MKKLLLITLLSLGCVLTSSAYTAGEIAKAGKVWISVKGVSGQLGWADASDVPISVMSDCDVTLDESGNLVLKDVYFTEFQQYSNDGSDVLVDIALTVDGTSVEVADGGEYYIGYGDRSVEWQGVSPYIVYVMDMYALADVPGSDTGILCLLPDDGYYYNYPKFGYYNQFVYQGKITGQVSKGNDGNYHISLGSFDVARLDLKNDYIEWDCGDGDGPWAYNPTYFLLFEKSGGAPVVYSHSGLLANTYLTNVTAQHTLRQDGFSASESFLAGVRMNGNDFTVENFGNLGCGYNVSMPANKYGKWGVVYEPFTGKIDSENLTVEIKPNHYGASLDPKDNDNIYIADICSNENTETWNGEAIGGIINGDVTHKIVNNHWLNTQRNDITVIQNPVMELEDYKMIYSCEYASPSTIEVMTFANTVIPFPAGTEFEYTHDAAVKIDFAGYGLNNGNEATGKYIYVTGQIQQLKNNALVDADQYEIYIMPHTEGTDFTHPDFGDTEFGHKNATRIDLADYYYHWKPQADATTQSLKAAAVDPVEQANANNSGLNFCLMVPESALKAKSADGKYALFVKAKYLDGNNLAPSFHGYTAVSPGVTGVIDIDGDVAAGIEVINGQIVITGSEGAAMVTNAAGAVIYQGGDTTLDVAPGLYIVRAGKTVKKLLVK